MYDLIIVGAGPAGLSAAVYGRRAGLDLLVIEEKPMGGGQVLNTYEVDNYLGMPGMNGFDMGTKFREHAERAGARFENAAVAGIADGQGAKIVKLADGTEREAKAVIIATGAEHRELGVPGEAAYRGRGVSYCAVCDGAFFRKKDVAVIGGGDVAVEDAVYLSALCRKVWLIHRRDSLRAAKTLQDRLAACGNVEILWNSTVQEIAGGDTVERLHLADAAGQFREELAVDGVFVAVGMKPNTEAFRKTVPCDSAGYVIAGEDCATQTAGIFAAGDVRTKQVRQIITAVSDGACAVASVQRYLV